MRPLLPRERVLVVAVGLIAAVMGFVLFVYQPKTAEADRLAQQLQSQQREVARVRAEAQRKMTVEDRVARLQVSLRALEDKLPAAREIPNLLLQLNDLAAAVHVDLRKIRPGELKSVTGVSPAQAASPLGAAQTRPLPLPLAPNPGPARPAVLSYDLFPIELAVQGDFNALLEFTRGIENFPRFLAISDIRLTLPPPVQGENPGAPRLTLTITANAYVISESEIAR